MNISLILNLNNQNHANSMNLLPIGLIILVQGNLILGIVFFGSNNTLFSIPTMADLESTSTPTDKPAMVISDVSVCFDLVFCN